jgi:hypothetical protein
MKENDRRRSTLPQDQNTALTQPNEDYCTSHTDDVVVFRNAYPTLHLEFVTRLLCRRKKINSNEDYSAEIPMSWWQPDTFDR